MKHQRIAQKNFLKLGFLKAALIFAAFFSYSTALAIFYNTGAFFQKSNTPPGSFNITGLTGSTDSTADAFLAPDTQPRVNFSSATGADTYDILIRNSGDTSTVCSETGVTSSPATISSCTLTHGTSYKVKITAVNTAGTTDASNQPYDFTVDTVVPTTNSITGIDNNGTDTTNDAWLVGGNIATVNWNAFTNASSYDVTIRDSGGSTVVCATQNTTATSYTFTGCTLTNGTVYTASVVGKSALGGNSTAASNNNYSFTVDSTAPGTFSITGLTGGSDSTADASLNTSADPVVNWGSSSNASDYDIEIRDSTGVTTLCSVSGDSASPATLTSCGLSDGTSYKAYVTANSASGFMTQTASNEPFDFTVSIPVNPPSDFMITGATGGDDVEADSWLTSGTEVTANWQTSYAATDYDVVIRNEADSTDVCSGQNTTATSYTFTACTLTAGSRYRIKVTANGTSSVNAQNNAFLFEIISGGPGEFYISGVTGANDLYTDHYLNGGSTQPIIAFTSSTGATSYDVTIRNSADTADVCATTNTTSSPFNFTGCTLTADTNYLVRVVAKNGTATTEAFNSAYALYVANAITFCPTGSSTAKALTIYDSGGAGADYGKSESCTFLINPTSSPSSIVLRASTFVSNDSGDILNIYNGTDATGTLITSRSSQVSAFVYTVYSVNIFLTWDSNNSPTLDGYVMYYQARYDDAGAFNITGVTGGTDTLEDGLLTSGNNATINWGTSSGAINYEVSILDAAGSNVICPKVTTASTSHSFSSCTLTWGIQYTARVIALNSNNDFVEADNNYYLFSVGNLPSSFSITGITGAADSTEDQFLEGDIYPTLNWQTSSLADSYDVTVFESDGVTQKCSTVNVASGNSSYAFSSCALTLNSFYRAAVKAKNANGDALASNNYLHFYVGNAWTPMYESEAMARHNHTSVWTGTEMIIWGGQSGRVFQGDEGFVKTGRKYNPSTNTWSSTKVDVNTPESRGFHSAVWTGTEMIIWGGVGWSGELNTGAKYNPSTDTWTATSVGANVPLARKYHSAVWTGTEMIIWGGNDATSYNTGAKYNPSTDSWTSVTTTDAPTARADHSAIWTGSEMIVWGGGSSENTGGKYNPSTNTWTATSTGANVPSQRSNYSLVWTGTEMIVWGGFYSGSYLNDGSRYDPSTNSWTAMTSTGAPSIRGNHAAIWDGSDMIIYGGYSSSQKTDGFKYDPSGDSWTSISTSGAPSTSQIGFEATAVWTGTEMIVWGGRTSGADLLSGGGKYNSSTDSWSSMYNGPSVPDPKDRASVVWTGSEMIVYGGQYASTKNGGKYNPTTDTWSTVSTGANSPSKRNFMSAVWTGTEMIIWGGMDTGISDTFGDGGKYNPISDSWTAMSTTGAPSQRFSTSAAWTGTEMIVWGGSHNSTYYTDGAKYNPTSDSWTAMTNTNAPTGRFAQSTVWTGDKMIVWGGYENGTIGNTGAVYDPTANTWTAISNTSAPISRAYHTAVWTGEDMIIWGGRTTGITNTGAIYNLATDTWTSSTTTTSAPTARGYHMAVWTGDKMIVWGGSNSTGSTTYNSGGIYDPVSDSWVATSEGENVPTYRRFAVSVWTGSQMLIFSGTGSGSQRVGGIYTIF